MNTFQLDESFDKKQFAEQCSAEGHCAMKRFPSNLRGKKDFEWFPILLAKQSQVLTTDFRIALHLDNRPAIPARNSGIIVIRPKKSESGFGSKRAIPLIANFKQAFSEWSKLDWSDAYVEITDIDAYVTSFADEHRISGETVSYDDKDFMVRLVKAVAEAQRIQRLTAD